MQWIKGLLVPDRLRLRVTAGPAGARAVSLLYQQRRYQALASSARRMRSLALSHGIGPRCGPPIAAFDELCELVGVEPLGAAAIQSGAADRLVVCIVGHPASVVVKVGALVDSGLATESVMLSKLEGTAGPVMVPRVRWHGPWRAHLVLATEALEAINRHRDLTLDEAADTATALCAGMATVGPLVHGDLSPWNVLRTVDGLTLVDWEEGRVAYEPLFDLAHFVITCAALLEHRPADSAVSLLTSPGSPGWQHLAALKVDPSTAPELLLDYLERTRDYEKTRQYRAAVLQALDGISLNGRRYPTSAEAAGAQPQSRKAEPR
jgi:hypothetical protein